MDRKSGFESQCPNLAVSQEFNFLVNYFPVPVRKIGDGIQPSRECLVWFDYKVSSARMPSTHDLSAVGLSAGSITS